MSTKPEFRETAYWEAFESFFRRLFRFAQSIPLASLPLETCHIPHREESGDSYLIEAQCPDCRRIITDHSALIQEWLEFACLQRNVKMLDAGANRRDGRDFYFLNNYIPAVTEALYRRIGSFKWKPSVARSLFKLIDNSLTNRKWRFRLKIPVFNVAMEQVSAAFDTAVLRRIRHDDLLLFALFLRGGHLIDSEYSPMVQTLIDVPFQKDIRHLGLNPAEPKELAIAIAAGILAVKKRIPMLGARYEEPDDFWSVIPHVSRTGWALPGSAFAESFNVTKLDISKVRSATSAYRSVVSSNPWLKVAVQRLLDYNMEATLENRVVDLMIVLETLYLPKSDAELNYRLAVRAASLLETSRDKKRDLFEFLRLAYALRCDVVHSGEFKSSNRRKLLKLNLTPQDVVERMVQTCCRTVERFICSPSDRSDLEARVFK